MLEPKVQCLWYSPLCDMVLARLQAWDICYDKESGYILSLPIPGLGLNKGVNHRVKVELISTRKFMDGVQVVDKPTAFVHCIPWTKTELDHLERIVNILRPNSPEIELVKIMRDLWTNPKGMLLSGGYKVLELPFYQGAVKSLINVMLEARSGTQKEVQGTPGKELFEA